MHVTSIAWFKIKCKQHLHIRSCSSMSPCNQIQFISRSTKIIPFEKESLQRVHINHTKSKGYHPYDPSAYKRCLDASTIQKFVKTITHKQFQRVSEYWHPIYPMSQPSHQIHGKSCHNYTWLVTLIYQGWQWVGWSKNPPATAHVMSIQTRPRSRPRV